MIGHEESQSTAENYRRFGEQEARLKSPLYYEFARGVAGDTEVLALLESLPVAKRQPNLLFAAVRYRFGTADDYRAFRTLVLDRWDDIRAVMLARRTQTNEPGRCALLLPVLAALPQPLALLEVGASAGLCLLPDRYRYEYTRGDGTDRQPVARLGPADSPVQLRCELRGPVPVPERLPEVVWRAGLDLDPVDLTDPDAVTWLETLVWPGAPERVDRLRAAVDLARRDPPRVVRGDLRTDLARLAGEAPGYATLVVFHTAVLAYVPAADRAGFGARVADLGATWIANEGNAVLPAVAERLRPAPAPPAASTVASGTPVPATPVSGTPAPATPAASTPAASTPAEAAKPLRTLLSRDGTPLAWAEGHGAWLEWL